MHARRPCHRSIPLFATQESRLPRRSSPSARSHVKTQRRRTRGRREEAPFVVRLFICPVGKHQLRAADQTQPGAPPAQGRSLRWPTPARDVALLTAEGKRKKKKAGFDGKRLPRAPAAPRKLPAHPAKDLGRGRTRAGRAQRGGGQEAFSRLTPLSLHLFVLYSNASICSGSRTR